MQASLLLLRLESLTTSQTACLFKPTKPSNNPTNKAISLSDQSMLLIAILTFFPFRAVSINMVSIPAAILAEAPILN